MLLKNRFLVALSVLVSTVVPIWAVYRVVKNWIDKKREDEFDLWLSQFKPVVDESTEESAESEVTFHQGIITDVSETWVMIDNKYKFHSSNVLNGELVAYTLKNDCVESMDVLNLEPVEDWNNNSDETIERSLDVSEKLGREYVLVPGPYSMNLDEVHSDFVPQPGDSLIAIFPSSTSSKITAIRPTYFAVVTGVITKILPNDNGVIDDLIVFEGVHLVPGYKPSLEDKIVCSIIRSAREEYNYRAILVSPRGKPRARPELIHGDGIYVCPKAAIQSEAQVLASTSIQVYNYCSVPKKITKVSTVVEEHFCCKSTPDLVVDVDQNYESEIPSDDNIEITVSAQSKSSGYVIIKLTVHFDDLSSSGNVVFVFHPHLPKADNYAVAKTTLQKLEPSIEALESLRDGNCHIGGFKEKRLNFVPVRMGMFGVPKALQMVASRYNKEAFSFDEQMYRVCELFVSLRYHLNVKSYRNRMHALLYLEEIADLDDVLALSCKTTLRRVGDFLVMDLPEDGPYSIITPDDLIYVWHRSRKFRGTIWKAYPHMLCAKFHQSFHNDYDGTTVEVYFEKSRCTFRRMHQAIDSVVNNQGAQWLFPTRVTYFTGESEEPPRKNYDRRGQFKWNNKGIGTGLPQTSVISNCTPTKFSSFESMKWFNKSLNEHQKAAVFRVLENKCCPMPYIVFGPPGTGKTVTLVEMILQLFKNEPKTTILVSATSNSAVNTVCLKLAESRLIKRSHMIRFCSLSYSSIKMIPAGVLPFAAIPSLSDNELPQGVENDIPLVGRKQVLRYRIVLGTLSTVSVLVNMGFPVGYFTHSFVDEAGYSSEPETLSALGLLHRETGRSVLLGDPQQLGPMARSKLATKFGLNVSLLVRLLATTPYSYDPRGFPETSGYNPLLVTLLKKSYRALPTLVELTSKTFYSGELTSTIDPVNSAEAKLTKSIGPALIPSEYSGLLNLDPNRASIIFHNVRSVAHQDGTNSWSNDSEIFICITYINKLYSINVSPDLIGFITPYRSQLKRFIYHCTALGIEPPKVGTVEEFEGWEKPIIIVSTVRSNFNNGEFSDVLGFVKAPERINVATSRAKSCLIVVGDVDQLSVDNVWRSLVGISKQTGIYIG